LGVIKVYSQRRGAERPPEGATIIKIDRSSPLGNPYRMSSEEQRDNVCEAYAHEISRRVKNDPAYRREMVRIYRACERGEHVALMCWCAPRRCHGDAIKDFIEQYLSEGK
jgi:hypothetical protein